MTSHPVISKSAHLIRGGVTMKFNIKHDTKTQKFYTVVGGKESNLKYDKVNDNLYNFKLLFVPKNLRGQGIAGKLMENALNYARKNMIRVKASCSYVQEYLTIHKEHSPLIYKRGEAVLPQEESSVEEFQREEEFPNQREQILSNM